MKFSRVFRSVVPAALLMLAFGVATVSSHRTQAQVAGKQIYPAESAAKADLNAALAKAKREGKRVIVDFGGDWCGDCQVLDIYFHQSPNAEIVEKHFIEVKVNIGQMDANLDVAKRCGVPLNKGVPALAVLDGNGKVLYSQANGEFESMRTMQSSDVTAFLNKWKS